MLLILCEQQSKSCKFLLSSLVGGTNKAAAMFYGFTSCWKLMLVLWAEIWNCWLLSGNMHHKLPSVQLARGESLQKGMAQCIALMKVDWVCSLRSTVLSLWWYSRDIAIAFFFSTSILTDYQYRVRSFLLHLVVSLWVTAKEQWEGGAPVTNLLL